jgi:hypothetical protein
MAAALTTSATAGQRAGRHAWLRASGDSAEPVASGTGIAAEAREVMGHLNRARKLFRNRMPLKAAPELRTAGEEFHAFAADHPGTRETMMLWTQLTSTVREALDDCQLARAASPSPRPLMCEGLEKLSASIAAVPRDGVVPLRGARRRASSPP